MNEVDLALWRPAEEIANDTREFMNNGEWELLSVPSHYWTLNLEDRDYAQIQFNVRINTEVIQSVQMTFTGSFTFQVFNFSFICFVRFTSCQSNFHDIFIPYSQI